MNIWHDITGTFDAIWGLVWGHPWILAIIVVVVAGLAVYAAWEERAR